MLIGLCGFARSGKDSVAKILVNEYGFEQTAFAAVMRQAALALNPIISFETEQGLRPHELRYADCIDLWSYDKAKTMFPEFREFLQRLGTEMGRHIFGQNFWVERTMAIIEASPEKDWAISDCRFLNEADAVRARGGVVIRVNRDGCEAANDHISEHELDDYDYDYVIYNEGPLDQLPLIVKDVLEDIGPH